MVAFNRKDQHGVTCSNFFFSIRAHCVLSLLFSFFFLFFNINCFCFDGYRLGFLIDFLSKATLVGFMSGAAVIVSLQQLKGLLGISHFTSKMQFIPVMSSVFKHRDEASGLLKRKEAFVRIHKKKARDEKKHHQESANFQPFFTEKENGYAEFLLNQFLG